MDIQKSMPEFQDLQDVENMLAETVASWKDTWIAEGMETGLSKGRAEGRLDNLMENIHALMETLGLPKEKAMDMLKVSEKDRARLSTILCPQTGQQLLNKWAHLCWNTTGIRGASCR